MNTKQLKSKLKRLYHSTELCTNVLNIQLHYMLTSQLLSQLFILLYINIYIYIYMRVCVFV